MADAKVRIIFIGQDQNASEVVDQVRDSLGDLGEAADKTGSKSGGFFTKLASNAANVKAAWDMLAGVGQAVGAIVSGAMDYESNLNQLQATSGATAAEMQSLAEKAKALGGDLSLPGTSAADAAEAMLELNKAGLSVKDTLGASKGVLQLSAAGQLSNAKAAEIAANALNAFNLEGNRAGAVADYLAAAANSSSSEVSDLADGMSMAAAVFSSLQGQVVGNENALVDLNTAMALLANNGIKGSDAGTSLKQSLLALAAPSDKAKGLMQDLAAAVGESGDLAYDAQGNMRSYRDIIDIATRATADMTQEQRDYYIATIFGADATRSINALMKEGVGSWDEMRGAVTKQGAAADLAGAKMKGLKGAIEGFTSTMETRTLAAIEPFLPLMEKAVIAGAEFADTVGTALQPALDGMAAGLMWLVERGDLLGPMLTGLTAATVAWATVALVSAVPSGTALAAALLKVAAAAQASLVALAPYALVAAAVAGVAYAYNDLSKKARSATDELLSQRTWWTDGAKALEQYASASDDVQARLKGTADGLRALQELQRSEIEAQMKTGKGPSQEQLDRWNARAEAIRQNTFALDYAIAAEERTKLVSEGLISSATAHAMAEGERAGAVRLSADEIKELGTAIEDATKGGTEALGSYIATETGFLDQLTSSRATHVEKIKALEAERAKATTETERKAVDERLATERQGFADSQRQQALAYAQEQAAQLAHLGRMLMQHARAVGEMNGVSAEEIGKMTTAIANEYGVQQTLAERTYGEMAARIEEWAISGGKNTDKVITDLGEAADQAVITQQKMDALAKDYVATLIQNFDEGKIDAEELTAALRKIPATVTSEVVIWETTRRRIIEEGTARGQEGGLLGGGASTIAGRRAAGGPVSAGLPYLVGEQGPEIIVPGLGGTVLSNTQSREALATGSRGDIHVGDIIIQNPVVDSEERLEQLAARVGRRVFGVLNGGLTDLMGQGAL